MLSICNAIMRNYRIPTKSCYSDQNKLSIVNFYYHEMGNAKSTSVAKCFFHSYASNCSIAF